MNNFPMMAYVILLSIVKRAVLWQLLFVVVFNKTWSHQTYDFLAEFENESGPKQTWLPLIADVYLKLRHLTRVNMSF